MVCIHIIIVHCIYIYIYANIATILLLVLLLLVVVVVVVVVFVVSSCFIIVIIIIIIGVPGERGSEWPAAGCFARPGIVPPPHPASDHYLTWTITLLIVTTN